MTRAFKCMPYCAAGFSGAGAADSGAFTFLGTSLRFTRAGFNSLLLRGARTGELTVRSVATEVPTNTNERRIKKDRLSHVILHPLF